MKAAAEDRLIASSPCVRVALAPTAHKVLDIPSAADVAALAAALPPRYAAVPYLAAGLGLRAGEVFGLDVADVDFLRRSVTVARQLDEKRGLGPLKTSSSYRTVPLPAVVADVLAAHLAGEKRRDGLVFLDAEGRPVLRNTFLKTWRAAVSRAGVDGSLSLHDLRHAYASALIVAGESVKVIQARMGHASAMVTLDVYGHLCPTRTTGRGPRSTRSSGFLRTTCGLKPHRRRTAGVSPTTWTRHDGCPDQACLGCAGPGMTPAAADKA